MELTSIQSADRDDGSQEHITAFQVDRDGLRGDNAFENGVLPKLAGCCFVFLAPPGVAPGRGARVAKGDGL